MDGERAQTAEGKNDGKKQNGTMGEGRMEGFETLVGWAMRGRVGCADWICFLRRHGSRKNR